LGWEGWTLGTYFEPHKSNRCIGGNIDIILHCGNFFVDEGAGGGGQIPQRHSIAAGAPQPCSFIVFGNGYVT